MTPCRGNKISIAITTIVSARNIILKFEKLKMFQNTRREKCTKHVARWFVGKVPQPPEDYPLELNGTCVASGDSLTVAYRIDELLYKMSVAVEFNVEMAEARCNSAHQMTYYVRLYQGPKHDTTLVEVSRWEDCGVQFCEERKRILDCAKYGLLDTKFPVPMQLPILDIQGLEDLYVPLLEEELKQMLEGVFNQLNEPHQDSQILALNNLASMTDEQVTHHKTAVRMAKMILESGELQLKSCFLHSPRKMVDSLGKRIRNASLHVLFNIIDLVSKDATRTKEENILHTLISSTEHDLFRIELIKSLKKDIEAYETSCPHNACLAIKCLRGILRCSFALIQGEIVSQDKKSGTLCAALEQALLFGRNCHYNLEHEAKSAIQDIIMFQTM